MSALADMEAVYGARPSILARIWESRTKYLVGAVLIFICVVMLLPLVASVTASFKTTSEASSIASQVRARSASSLER